MQWKVLSLGGSVISPKDMEPDSEYLSAVIRLLATYTKNDISFVIITGGGSLARKYQTLLRAAGDDVPNSALDTVGIAATWVHANLIAELCRPYGQTALVAPPPDMEKRDISIAPNVKFLMSGGWFSGVSTDYIAVRLAEITGSKQIFNISDVSYIYTADPAIIKDATPLPQLNWDEYLKIVGSQWKPGGHVPFDPKAAQLAQQLSMRVQFVNKEVPHIKNALNNLHENGTMIT